ncbi:hypothetical protein L2B92_000681 [Salmonella enterica subsp. enterica serovar Give]|nr:hypothetical protein [Salmonella enterica subsp. enterica serovar Give]EIT4365699.1 hypothetical protein [Salmonella enterica subsp. enterica serovar Give]
MKPSYEELEAKCLALAAENAGLKASIPQQRNVEFDNDSMDDISLAEDVGFNDAIGRMKINMSKTPATDAFLAEVRAQGVEMFAKQTSESDQGNGLMKAISRRAIKFAARLRKEDAL